MSNIFELIDRDGGQSKIKNANITVVGVGGGGCNAVQDMVAETIVGVRFVCLNTDAQALENCAGDMVYAIGGNLTKGLGAGSDPKVGKGAAEESSEQIREILEGSDMVFVAVGMGGGTGTGAAPVVAEIAKKLGILTVAVVTRPFSFEGKARARIADEGINNLAEHVDCLITIPNNKLLSVFGKQISLLNAFKAANSVLCGAVKGISELITCPGFINVDFADVRTVMSEMGMAMMGTGSASGESRARIAAETAISSPLLEDINLAGAKGILANITCGIGTTIGDFEEVGEVIKSFISDNATVVIGTVIDPGMKEDMRVTIVVTGLSQSTDGKPLSMVNKKEQLLETIDYDRSLEIKGGGGVSGQSSSGCKGFKKESAAHFASPVDDQGSLQVAEDNLEYFDIPAFLRKEEQDK